MDSLWMGCLALLLASICGTYGKTHEPFGVRYTTFSCGGGVRWCGETWRADRILSYNYTVWSEVVVKNTTVTEIRTTCSFNDTDDSGINSTACRTTSSAVPITSFVRVRRFNRTHLHTEKLPASLSGLEIIKTDNINADGNLTAATYSPNQDTIWQIKIPRHCRMVIYFSMFNIKSSPDCMLDNFTVQTSKRQADIHKYCDTLHQIEINYRRRVQLWFHSSLFDPELDDPLPAKRGIFATMCFASRLSNSPPCSCNSEPVPQRREAPVNYSETEYRQLKKQTVEKDKQVGAWLVAMMQGGQPVVEDFLKNSSNPDQQYLAQKYRALLDLYSHKGNS